MQTESRLKEANIESKQARDDAIRYENQKFELQEQISDMEFKIEQFISNEKRLGTALNTAKQENREMEIEIINLKRNAEQMTEQIKQYDLQINKSKNNKKIALLVRKPIFDEMRMGLGEAYVEESITMRSNVEYEVFGDT